MEKVLKNINNNNKAEVHISSYSPLTLAYLGDGIFELLVRSLIVKEYNTSVNNLNKRAKNMVKAEAQAKMYHKIIDILTDDEMIIMKRGRNAKSFTSAKNASMIDYRHATGLECLFGYLYLNNEEKRMIEIFNKCVEK